MNCRKRGAKVTDSKLLDSSVWLAYLFDGKYINEIESDKQLFISILSLFEIKTKLMKKKIKEKEVLEKINFIKKKSAILHLNEEIAEKAAEISAKKNLPAIDSLIYSSALFNNIELITLDNDFRGLKRAIVLV